jgi:hypothetical protein
VSHRITAKLLVDKEKIDGLSFQSYDCGPNRAEVRYILERKLGVSECLYVNLENRVEERSALIKENPHGSQCASVCKLR